MWQKAMTRHDKNLEEVKADVMERVQNKQAAARQQAAAQQHGNGSERGQTRPPSESSMNHWTTHDVVAWVQSLDCLTTDEAARAERGLHEWDADGDLLVAMARNCTDH